VSIKFRKEKKVNKNMGISIAHNTNNTYENGDRCVRIWKMRGMRMNMEDEGNAFIYLHTHT